MNYDFNHIPEPIQFNLWKHHLNYIKGQIKNSARLGENATTVIKHEILKIGASQMDLYIGDLSPYTISLEIINKLAGFGIKDKILYEKWISSETKFYRSLILSDNSKWILRQGNDERKYIHIHPARSSSFCIRIKAVTLKTAILISLLSCLQNSAPENLSLINSVRKEFLDEPPIKSLAAAGSLIKLLKLIDSVIQ